MKLRFLAKEGQLVTVPGSQPGMGQAREYVGWKLVRKVDKDRGLILSSEYVRTDEPFECDSDSDMGRRLVKLTRRDGSLEPADKDTAEACGLSFAKPKTSSGASAGKAS